MIPTISSADIVMPITDTSLDSIDLLVLRVAIEKYFRMEISDSEWYQFNSIHQALTHFHEQKDDIEHIALSYKNIKLKREQEIRMPQMANDALAENWLLKELGDIHWSLISKGLEQKTSEFRDDLGNRLYATFVRISYLINPLSNFQENEIINFEADIKRFGNNAYYSEVSGLCNEKKLHAFLATSFTHRENKGNEHIAKSNPKERTNHIQQLKHIPEFLTEYRLLKKGLLEELKFNEITFYLGDSVILTINYVINPYYDINGVGLLYFASYPIITDKCVGDFLKEKNEINNFDSDYQTVYRDIFYFANCNRNDLVVFKLNSIEKVDNKLVISSSLFRHSDNTLMVRIFTIKQSN